MIGGTCTQRLTNHNLCPLLVCRVRGELQVNVAKARRKSILPRFLPLLLWCDHEQEFRTAGPLWQVTSAPPHGSRHKIGQRDSALRRSVSCPLFPAPLIMAQSELAASAGTISL